MGIPVIYDKGEQVLATYDFYDVASGTGYVRLYGCDFLDEDASPTSWARLITSQVYGDYGYTQSQTATAVDKDFDLIVESPIIIEGKIIINLWGGSANNPTSTTANIDFYVVDKDGNETHIGTQIQKAFTFENNTLLWSAEYEVPNNTIKAGERLRMSLTTTACDAATHVVWLHDPANRNDISNEGVTWTSSQLTIDLPIKL